MLPGVEVQGERLPLVKTRADAETNRPTVRKFNAGLRPEDPGIVSSLLGQMPFTGWPPLVTVPRPRTLLESTPCEGSSRGVPQTEWRRLVGATRGWTRKIGATLTGVIAIVAFDATAASAQDFVVSNLNDAGNGSLRDVVEQANALEGPDRITFGPGGRGTISLESQLVVNDQLEIDGSGTGTVVLDGGRDSRVISAVDTNLEIRGLTIRHGGAEPGAGIWSRSTNLTVTDSVLADNEATGDNGIGGGIFSALGGSLTISRSTLSRNFARIGGGVTAHNVPVQIQSSTFAGNRALGSESFGGALFAADIPPDEEALPPGFETAVPVDVSNSTFFGNQSERSGGAFAAHGHFGEATLQLRSSTVSGNSAAIAGGGVAGGFLSVLLTNSIVHGNTAPAGPDISSAPPYGDDTPTAPTTAFDARFSLVGSTADGQYNDILPGSNLIGVNPLLTPLAENGGPTRTMALRPASAVIDQGSSDLGEDQRGETRPFEQPDVPNSRAPGADGSDMGAFELTGPTPDVDPSNRFVFKRLIRKPRRGIAIQRVKVPGPGRLVLIRSKKVRRTVVRFKRAGRFGLKVRTKRRAKKKLLRTGKVRLRIRVRFVPAGGKPAVKARNIRIVKRPRPAARAKGRKN